MLHILNRFYSTEVDDIIKIDATPALPNALFSQLPPQQIFKINIFLKVNNV